MEELMRLRAYLARFRFNYASEDDLQRGIAAALDRGGFQFERERRLQDLGRLDFLLVGGIVIETKIGGSANELKRQVARYAASAEVHGILVVTDRASHALPQSFNEKPLLVHSLLDGAL